METGAGLYLVGTPIGNLGDLSRRVEESLRSADVILAEDTRRARALLSHLGISAKDIRRFDQNARPKDIAALVARLEQGVTATLVTDAGMPSVSDPGSILVRACRERGIPIRVVPGPSAVTTAVAASGLVDGGFCFVGFLPRKGAAREEALRKVIQSEDAVVLFEAPQRVAQTLSDLAELVPDRQLCVARELTKQFEEIGVLPVAEWNSQDREWRGEFTLVLEGRQGEQGDEAAVGDADLDALIELRLGGEQSARDIAEALSAMLRVSRRRVYQRVLVHTKNL